MTEESTAFCVALAASAWNQARGIECNHRQLEEIITELESAESAFWNDLKSHDWREIHNTMYSYIMLKHKNDNRIIRTFGTTEHGTVKIEWTDE